MVVVNMKNVGQIVAEGTYPVVLTKATEKSVAKGDVVTLIATIKDSDTDWDGKPVFRSFFISNDEDADNGTTLYYLQQTLLAFGADEDDVTSDTLNPVELAKELYGNSATATVTHTTDKNNPEKKYANASFSSNDF